MKILSRAAVAALLAASAVPIGAARRPAPPEITRIVYVTANDQKGAPVTDLTADEFTVKEGGKARDVIGARIATAPLQIALLVDDNGTGIFRYPLARFVERLDGRASFSLSTVVGQTMKLVDYTSSVAEINGGIAQLNAKPGTPDGGQLLEAIFQALRELDRREAQRPVVIALTVGGEEHSTVPSHQVLDELQKTGASLHVFLVVGSSLRQTAAITKPAALLEENFNLNEVLGDGPKQSGGRRNDIVAAPGVLEGLQRLADELKHQYAITYTLPAGDKPSGRMSVSVTRKGIVLRAPTRVPKR